MKTAVLCARISPRQKETETNKEQLFELRVFCDRNGVKILSEHKDELGPRGTPPNQHGLKKAIRIACENKATLFVYSLSRVATDIKSTIKLVAQLQEAGASFKTLNGVEIDTSTALGKREFRFLLELTKYFGRKDGIKKATSCALLQKQGVRVGNFVPTGWKDDVNGPVNEKGRPSRMVPNWDERRAVIYMKHLRSRKTSIQAIAKAASEKYPYRGGEWSVGNVRNVLAKPLTYDEMSVEEINEAIKKEKS